MARSYHLFRGRDAYHAVADGPAWTAVPLPWLWAFRRQLWFRGGLLLALDALGAALVPTLLALQPVALALVFLIPRLVTLLRGTHWSAAQHEILGHEFLGRIAARNRSDAIAQVARRQGVIPDELRPRASGFALAFPPPSAQQLWAIAKLTVGAAFRYRLVVVMIALLLGAVVALPLVIKHDGTAQGFTQILLTYTLGVITAVLSLVTLWLACGTLARDVDECQMQMVATKPIPRWQIWLGKWTGIMLLNAMLLGVTATAVFILMQWRATQLPLPVQQALRDNVLTARASAREPAPDFEARVEAIIRERLPDLQANQINLQEFRKQALDTLKAREQVVPPDHYRRFRLNLAHARNTLAGKPIFARIKFYTPTYGPKRAYEIEIEAGPDDSPERRGAFGNFVPETVHELALEAGPLDANGILIIDIANRSDTALLFPADEGLEILYREGGFGLNFVRAILVILCWIGLLAAIGLAAASFLSFPVAAFLATTVLILGMSTGVMKTVVEDQTVLGLDHETNAPEFPLLDSVMVPVFKSALDAVNLVRQFSPIDAVSSGRSITWFEVVRAATLVIGVMGGAFAAIGITAFTRRELATAQSHH